MAKTALNIQTIFLVRCYMYVYVHIQLKSVRVMSLCLCCKLYMNVQTHTLCVSETARHDHQSSVRVACIASQVN